MNTMYRSSSDEPGGSRQPSVVPWCSENNAECDKRLKNAESGLVFHIRLGGTFSDQVDRLLTIRFGLVTLARRGNHLTVRRIGSPPKLVGMVLVDFEHELVSLLLDPLHALLAIRLGPVALAGRGENFAVASLQPPAKLLRSILIDFELEAIFILGHEQGGQLGNCQHHQAKPCSQLVPNEHRLLLTKLENWQVRRQLQRCATDSVRRVGSR